jgi:hypothetical protein
MYQVGKTPELNFQLRSKYFHRMYPLSYRLMDLHVLHHWCNTILQCTAQLAL